MNGRLYLDWNAATPLRPEARAAMIAAMDLVGNASSIHAEGRAVRGLIEAAAGQPEAHRGAGQVAVSLRETRPPMPRNRPAHAHSAHAA